MIFILIFLTFLSLSGLLSNQLGAINEVFSLSPVNPVASFQLPVLFLGLLSFFYFTFLPWGVNLVLGFGAIFFISLVIFVSINLVGMSKSNFQLHLVGSSESLVISLFFYFIHLLGDLMKPLSLTLRLLINLTFGHLLIMLMCSILSSPLGLAPFIAYEGFVFLVQSFIFATLTNIYLS